jgi:hypothetical protein
MSITLNHTIVPAHDKEESAKFFAHMFELKYLIGERGGRIGNQEGRVICQL